MLTHIFQLGTEVNISTWQGSFKRATERTCSDGAGVIGSSWTAGLGNKTTYRQFCFLCQIMVHLQQKSPSFQGFKKVEQSTNLCWQRRPTTINHCLTSQTILKQGRIERGGRKGNIAFILYELGWLILLSFAFYGCMQKLGVQVHCPQHWDS